MERIGIQALKRCVAILGGQNVVAELVNGSQQNVSACIRNGKRVPAEWCIPLETATAAKGKKVSRHEFRPDLYPPPAKADSRKASARRTIAEARP